LTELRRFETGSGDNPFFFGDRHHPCIYLPYTGSETMIPPIMNPVTVLGMTQDGISFSGWQSGCLADQFRSVFITR
jgi:hypothetical protein